MLISRQRLLDRTLQVRDATLIVIAAENEFAEKQYFALFESSRVKIEVLATGPDGKSAPAHVMERLVEFRERYAIGPSDELVLMIDYDNRRWEELKTAFRDARNQGVFIAVSNPSFEVWLLLHHTEADPANDTSDKVEAHLRTVLGSFNKKRLVLDDYRDRIPEAIARAKALDTNAAKDVPDCPGTRVYVVVERILSLLNP